MTDALFSNPEPAQPVVTPAEPTSGEAAPTGQEPKVEPQVSTDPNSLFADRLANIKAEDGRQKYADVPTALDSIPHAQARIQELANENARIKAELEQKRSIEEMLERIEESKQSTAPTSGESVLDASSVEALLDKRLAQLKQAEVMENNRSAVVKALTDKYGDKAEEVFSQRAKDLGMDAASLSDLALQHPNMVLSHFEVVRSPDPQAVRGTVTTTAVKPSPTERKSVAYGSTTKQVVEQWRNHAST